jgi:hypothetical protein
VIACKGAVRNAKYCDTATLHSVQIPKRYNLEVCLPEITAHCVTVKSRCTTQNQQIAGWI